jgi:uroporphyrinogen decarboxylase
MNGYQRIKAALSGEFPDKVPVMLHNFMMAAHESGVTMEQYRNSPRVIADVFIKSMEKFQYDGILVDIDTVTMAGALGVPIDFPTDEPARTTLGNLRDLDSVKYLEPVNIENYKYIAVWLESVRILKEYYKDEVFVRGNCDQAPFSLAGMMRGAQNWMIDLMMSREDFIFQLLEYCTEACVHFIRLMAQTGCDMVSNGDSPAGPSMVSPDMYEKYALPYETILAESAHKAGLPYALHICGDTGIILDKMIRSGADAFELDYKTDVGRVYDLYHEKVTLIGNIDPSGVLALGTPDQVRSKTEELLKIYSGSPRFILNAGCALPSLTPPENIRVMIGTAREFR